MQRGKFIVVEGADGAGTTTISKYIAGKIETKFGKNSVILTSEPSSFDIGVFIRKVLKKEKTVSLGLSMAYLFMADRVDHTRRRIIPALEIGQHVVCDRYLYSTLAYQSVRKTFSESYDVMMGLGILMQGHIQPDLVLFLDCEFDTLKQRRKQRGDIEELYEEESIQRMVVDLYREQFTNSSGPFCTIDAEQSLVAVKARTWNSTKELFS